MLAMSKHAGWAMLILSMAVLVTALVLRRVGVLGQEVMLGISIAATVLAFVGRAVVKSARAREHR